MANNPKSITVVDYIKTKANLNTLAGGGSLTKGSDTLTADEDRLYLVDDTSVLFEEQTLTAEQQAQARTNIGAGTSNFSGSYNDLTDKPTIPTVNNATLTIQKNGTTIDTFTANASSDKTINIIIPTSASDVSALPSSTKYGSSFELSINSSTYVITATLKDQDGNTLGTTQTIDLPLESVVVSGSYDSANKKVVLTLQSGSTVEFSVADLVSGLQTEITSQNKLDADYIADGTTNKVFTVTEQSKLSGIESGAEVNVQSDWNQTDTTADDYIKNKPTIPTDTNQKIKTSSVTFGNDDVVQITAGSNVTVTGDASAKTITIASSFTDTGATSIETTGNGNAVTTASYNGTTRKITLTKGTTFLTQHQNINGKANTDASNLTSSNVSSWASTCGFERVETVYDKDSANSSINWGYTSGIGNNITVNGKDFSKYKRLRVSAQYDWQEGCCFEIDLKHLTSESYYSGGSVYSTFWENVQMFKYCRANVNTTKTSITIYCGLLATNHYLTDGGKVVMIEGVY